VAGRGQPPGASLRCRFIFDSRDEGTPDRMQVLGQANGLWRCRTAHNCTEACPRAIPATQAIEDVKRELLWRRA